MNIGKLITGPIILLLGLFLALQVFSEGGNILGNVAAYIGVGAFVFGVLKPQAGMYVMVIAIAYVDLLKRMLSLDFRFSIQDTASILSIPLALMFGMCVGLGVLSLLGRIKIPTVPFIIGNLLTLTIGGIMILLHGFSIGALAEAANAGAYCVLFWVVPVVCPTRKDIWKLCHWMLIVFIPVGVVGIKQLFYGYSAFETDYLLSGASIEIKQLFGDGIRPFATMASPGNFSCLMSVCAVLSIILWRTKKDLMGKPASFWFTILFVLFFMFAGFCSMKRGPMLVWMLSFAGMFALRSWWSVGLSYIAGIGTVVFLGLNYEWAFDLLMAANQEMRISGEVGGQVSRLGTFNARLESIALLFEADQYSWFGIEEEQMTDRASASHGMLLTILTRVGVVPLIAVGLVFSYFAFKIHSGIIRLPRKTVEFRFAIGMGSLGLALLAGTAGGVVFISSFPMNFITFFALSITLVEVGVIKRLKPGLANSGNRVSSNQGTMVPNRGVQGLAGRRV